VLLLRIALGVALIAALAGFVFLASLAASFRRSFGADPRSLLFLARPFLPAGLFAATLLWPASLPLLHLAAGVALVLVALVAANARRLGPPTSYGILAWLALWGLYYAFATGVLAAPGSAASKLGLIRIALAP
jgi:hypothetical protein